MLDTIIFYFLVLVLVAITLYALFKAAGCDTPTPTFIWLICSLVIWMLVLIPITDTYEHKSVLKQCTNEDVRERIDRHFELANKVYNDYNSMDKISELVDEYEAIQERLHRCVEAFNYFPYSDHYRYSWLNSLAEFTKYSITDPEKLVQEHRGAIHSIRVYLRDRGA